MPILVEDSGKNNVVEMDDYILKGGAGRIIFEGDGNKVVLKSPVSYVDIDFYLEGGASIHIGERLNGHSLFIHAARGSAVRIGHRADFNGWVRLMLHEAGSLTIGDGCLFGSHVDVTISDMHSIIDIPTGARINPARNVVIGDRVWIGQRSMVLKGARIGSGSVIGAGSIVTRDIPPNCAAAGNPAQVIRENVTWDFKLR